MEFGICVPHYGKPVDIERILGVARSAEELGFASVWVTDFFLYPLQQKSSGANEFASESEHSLVFDFFAFTK